MTTVAIMTGGMTMSSQVVEARRVGGQARVMRPKLVVMRIMGMKILVNETQNF